MRDGHDGRGGGRYNRGCRGRRGTRCHLDLIPQFLWIGDGRGRSDSIGRDVGRS